MPSLSQHDSGVCPHHSEAKVSELTALLITSTVKQTVRPSLKEKLFPVYRPGGSKRADWNLFFPLFKKLFLFLLFPLYILV